MSRPPAGGVAPVRGTIRTVPVDFKVDERLGFEPDGEGEHVLLHVEKTDANTAWVAGQLARLAGVRNRDVGFAGRKDRRAVCRQWFSIWLPGVAMPDWQAAQIEGVEVLRAARHGRKLRPGYLAGNDFDITVRDVSGDLASLEARLRDVEAQGVPNYFGAQRFGRHGSNVQAARDWFSGARRLRARERSMALSAARSLIFNEVLAARIAAGTWCTALPGDCLSLDGSGSYFYCETPDKETETRLAAADIHVSGPLWGEGPAPVTGEVAVLEEGIAARHADLADGLCTARMKHERRALRMRVNDLQWSLEGNVLKLQFALGRGSFATAVLDALIDTSSSAQASPQEMGRGEGNEVRS